MIRGYGRTLVSALCGPYPYVWGTHLPIAHEAGVRQKAIDHLEGAVEQLTSREAAIVGLVIELCSSSSVSPVAHARAVDELGATGVVELSVLVGYYTMLSYTMSAFDVCRSIEDE